MNFDVTKVKPSEASLSIVTVVFNDYRGLKETVQSIKQQTYRDLEYIIVDGGSTDGSLKVIRENEELIDFYLSEPDKGIYDAMNKGLEHCHGDFVLFLNAGDCLASDQVLDSIVNQIKDNNKTYFGRAKIKRGETTWLYPSENIISQESAEKWLSLYLPNHQAMLFPKSFYQTNRFNLSFRIFGDADYKIRSLKSKKGVFIDVVLSTFQLGGISSSSSQWKVVMTQFREYLMIRRMHYKGRPVDQIIQPIIAFKFIGKYLFNRVFGQSQLYKLLKLINLLR